MDYRAAWRRAPWLLPFPVVGIVLLLLGIVGTIGQDPAAICFVPGVLVLLLHHFLALRVNR
jgi:hypothetical protein